MKFRDLIKIPSVIVMVALVLVFLPCAVFAADDISEMRRQLEEQRVLIQIQQEQLNKQAQQLEKMSQRLDELTAENKNVPIKQTVEAAAQTADEGTEKAVVSQGRQVRDNIGDLNSDSVKAGDFVGSFKLPGTKDISLRIGGFIKSVVIADSDAENMGADFIPANLGTRRDDSDGAFSIDATLSRWIFDARAPARQGQLRGYLEWDLNKNNNGDLDVKTRHAYGAWNYKNTTLLAGQTWSTFMDLQIIPEGLTEPTVSGVIFMRQPMVRLSQKFAPGFKLDLALEDPNSGDVFYENSNPELNNTKYPDIVLAMEIDRDKVGHLRLGGITRHLNVNLPDGGKESKTAWGGALTGHLELWGRDRLMLSGIYGKGLGRYLLGIQSVAGAAIDPIDNDFDLRTNWGTMAAYEHHWSDSLRSTAMAGYAKSDPLSWQSGDLFESSIYASANLMWEVLPYLTIGTEYAYGKRENEDGSNLDNHRLALGFQFY